MKRSINMLTLIGAVILAALTLQPQPFSVGSDNSRSADRRAEQTPPPELVEQWLEVAEEVDPARARQLRAMCHSNPEEFHRVMRQAGRSIVGLAELKNRDPDMYETKLAELRIEAQVEASANSLVEAIRAGDNVKAAAIEEELRRLVLMQVLHSLKAKGDYLNRLKEHVQRLEAELQEAAENWQKTMEQRAEEIISRSRTEAINARE